MGVVYEAMDVERGVRVALKTVIHRDADALARFKHEFRALQDIHHPNLVALGELLGGGNELFFTMELVEGVDLLTYIRGVAPRPTLHSSATAVDLRPAEPDTVVVTSPSFEDRSDGPSDPTPLPDKTPASHVTIASIPPAAFDEKRLRDAFRQIALGLDALHDAKRVHRDIKPSNVRVTPEGRVVLLDFGLVFESGQQHQPTELTVVGTPAYMAPEQAGPTPVGPAADWYAVGVMLYYCLVGRLPFEGAGLAVLMAKQYREPLAPGAVVRDVPPDLDALCMDLLKFEAGARPSGREVRKRLNAVPDPAGPTTASQPGTVPFVGRSAELLELERAFAQVVSGREAVTVALYGESGVGKSCLLRRFLDERLGAKVDPPSLDATPAPVSNTLDTLILTGRCYEREAVPYKALDEVIDTLSRRLARLEKQDALALLPPNVEPLAQLFPALCRIPGVSQGIGPFDVDPHERRREAFRALRALFARIARVRPLVIAIDDLQWTDADSLSLLVELLRPPDAPSILLLVTIRGAAATDGALEVATGEHEVPPLLASLPGDVRPIHVGRLAVADARQLAARLLRRASPGLGSEADAIADEAAGHPLFIDELVRHAALTSGAPAEALRLDDALWARVSRLEPTVRRVLDVACVVGAPIAQEIVAHAARLEMREFARSVSLLRTSNLVKTRGARVTDAIEPYHDRVREAVVARLTDPERRERHEWIAGAIELSKSADPEVLSVHWAGAGETAKGSRYAVVAAEQAAQALAFDRAARLYQRALDLAPAEGASVPDDARRRSLRKRLADALANTGKGLVAAAEYERAAEGAPAAEALDLRRRAAEQLLRGGEIKRGTEATRAVLASVGLSFPKTMLGAVVALLFYRLVLALRGFAHTSRDESDIAPNELTRLDICWSVSFTLPYADALRGAVFQALHVLLALRAGEPFRVSRALSTESAYLGTFGAGGWLRTERMIAKSFEAAERTGSPYARGMALATSGIAYCMNLRFAGSIERLERAIQIFREKCPGSAWEVTTAQFFQFVAMSYSGRFRELRAQHEAALLDAVERGDQYGAVMLRVGVLNRIWWVGGDPARARRELAEAARAWPTDGYHVMHFHLIVGECYVDLYEGEWERAHARAMAEWPALRRSLLLKVDALRLEWLGVRLRTTIAAAAAIGDDRKPEREALLRQAERALREYGPLLDHPVNRPTLLTVRASVAASRGKLDVARGLLERLAALDGEEAWVTREAARWALGRMRGGIEGGAQVRAAEAKFTAEGVSPDRRLILVLLPGLARHV